MKAIAQRLAEVERRVAARQEALGPAVLVVVPDDWSPEDRLAYGASSAAGDRAARRDLVERHAGKRPGPGTTEIEIRRRDDGPQ